MIKNIFKLSWRNIWRNKRRTVITFLAVAVGVMTLIFMQSYINGIMNSATDAMVKLDIGHIKLVNPEYLRLKRIMPKEYMVPDIDRVTAAVNRVKGVDMVDPRIRFNVLLSHGNDNEIGIAVGMDPPLVDDNIQLSHQVTEGRYLERDGRELIIGRKLAEKLNVAVDDELLLITTDINYSSYALAFKIVGIFETGYSYMDKYLLFLPLPQAQTMLDCGNAAHEVLLFIDDPERAVAVAGEIRTALAGHPQAGDIEVIPWQQDELLGELVPMMQDIWGAIMKIIMLIVGLVILNTMLMTVMERFHEIGVMKALGFKNLEVFVMIMVEAAYIGVIGALVGGALGGPLSAWLEKTGIDVTKMLGEGLMEKFDIPIPMLAKILYPDFSLAILIHAIVFGVIVALIAVLYPAIKSLRMSPVEAFRSELKV